MNRTPDIERRSGGMRSSDLELSGFHHFRGSGIKSRGAIVEQAVRPELNVTGRADDEVRRFAPPQSSSSDGDSDGWPSVNITP